MTCLTLENAKEGPAQSDNIMAFTKEQKRAYRQTAQHKKTEREFLNRPETKASKKRVDKKRDAKAKRKLLRRVRKYGLTLRKFFRMISDQCGRCKICGKKLDMGRHTHIDHCHTTGKVRGILCRGCNLGLGNLKDSVDILEKAIQYLRDHD